MHRKEPQKYQADFDVNGEIHSVEFGVGEPLLSVLRRKLSLTGAKPGCLNGDCGACTVMLGDTPYKSCIMLAIEALGQKITTIEGLRETPIQEAFVEQFAFQCGYCTPGFILNCHALLLHEEQPTDEMINEWLSSNICRCTSYQEIEGAIKSVIRKK